LGFLITTSSRSGSFRASARQRARSTRRGGHERGIRYTKTHLWRLWTSGQFPRPTKIGGGRNVWLESEIDAYIKARLDARDQVAA
jgi:prophage regulatory protein